MSTFDGIVSEFPHIRIDFFRTHPSLPPPLACFLSHIHSDHLQGLESLKAPFVYCSAATRQLLLNLEKHPHRMNFMRGVLERRKLHYKHLKFILKAIPLDCPIEIELGPLEKIRVTLFDANHCPGAVMFLIEAENKAVLYTGDIRAEPWWVNSLTRSPILLPYTTGLRRLDRMYLDTTFAIKENIFQAFQSKSEGILELLEKTRHYPPDTVFYLSAWTTGYEDVWIALASFLKCSVHLGDYQLRFYGSLSHGYQDHKLEKYSALNGFRVGNHFQKGCLTSQSTTRIHSCEPGTSCHSELQKSKHVVWIIPIVTRSEEGLIIPEVGAGGGGRDLRQISELDLSNFASVEDLRTLFEQWIECQASNSELFAKVESAFLLGDKKISLEGLGIDPEQNISLGDFLKRMSAVDRAPSAAPGEHEPVGDTIYYPYSRHSSYTELCELVGAFKPVDIYPCTINEDSWAEVVSMKALFGHLCSGTIFAHDRKMRERFRCGSRHEYLAQEFSRKGRVNTRNSDSPESLDQRDLESIPDANNNISEQVVCTHGEDTRNSQVIDASMAPDQDLSPARRLAAVRSVYEAHMTNLSLDQGSATACINSAWKRKRKRKSSTAPATRKCDSQSQVSISLSALDSQSSDVTLVSGLHVGSINRVTASSSPSIPPCLRSSRDQTRLDRRLRAYQAAKATLQSGESGEWDDLGIRSIGVVGRCDFETEL